MKANEVMIGDWVSCGGHYRKIQSLEFDNTEEEKCWFWSDEDQALCLLSEHDPIPLTPEILEKNGFKIDKNETYCKRYIFACNLNKIPQTVVEFSFYGEGVSADTLFKCWTKPESCDGENSIHICDLKSVHQLQHALRLCGISKEIVL